ncbi:unnamed protein product [Polarella glacialis]|uniref:Uncharacterized protein n=1 Tax=Polarella glacialis TaxID=89957 RepID=A0A813GIQ0_POLGL|nr:unnamed protein product [Polarella glacialis]
MQLSPQTCSAIDLTMLACACNTDGQLEYCCCPSVAWTATPPTTNWLPRFKSTTWKNTSSHNARIWAGSQSAHKHGLSLRQDRAQWTAVRSCPYLFVANPADERRLNSHNLAKAFCLKGVKPPAFGNIQPRSV